MNRQRRIHDGIVGLLVTAGAALAYWVHPLWWILPGAVGLLLIQSAFSGFCPVYFTLELLGVGKPAAETA